MAEKAAIVTMKKGSTVINVDALRIEHYKKNGYTVVADTKKNPTARKSAGGFSPSADGDK